MDATDLSVIILTYNTRELTRACVQSVLADAATSGLNIEVIVVDNGSSDGTAHALRQACAAAPLPARVQVIENADNLGFARGNNVGLAAAQGRYRLLLNSDTVVVPGALTALVHFMDAHPDAGACGPMLLNPDGTLQPSGRPLPTLRSLFVDMTRLYRLTRRDMFAQRGRDYTRVAKVGELSGAALMIRREVYERVGGFDPNLFAYYEDVDLCKRIGDAGYAIYYVPQAQITHLWKRSSQALPEVTYRAGISSARYYFRKHYGRAAEASVQLMLVAREAIRIVVALARGQTERVRFHRRMLTCAADLRHRPDAITPAIG